MADLRSLARAQTETAVRVLTGIMREKRSPPSARVAACEALLNRGWGKAVQPVAAEGELALQITIRNIIEEVQVIEPREVKVIDDKSK